MSCLVFPDHLIPHDHGAVFICLAGKQFGRFHLCAGKQRFVFRPGKDRSLHQADFIHEIFPEKRSIQFASAFQQEHGREPSGAEIMSACSWSREELEKVMMYRNADTITSLDEPFTDEDGERTLADTISSGADPAEEVGEEIFRDQLKRDLWGTVDALPDDQARALRMHYQGQRTFQEIGAELGTSEADGRTICAKGLRALRSDRDTRRKLGPYYVDIYGMAMRGGLNSFMSSRTSATERAALIDLGEWWKK